jgi:ribosomal protein L4
MSMKRTKQRGAGGGRDKDTEVDFWAKPAAPERSWGEEIDGKPDNAFMPYALSARYAKGQLVVHTKFGKGVVVGADASRVEILFQEGKKKLGHAQQV